MPLDPQSDRALYQQLADILRTMIESGDLAPGTKLPSETTLSQQHNLARPAVRNAIAVLRSEGLVATEKGSGTRVRELPTRDEVHLLPGDTVICRMPTDLERRRLELHVGVPVLVVSRAAGRTEHYAGDGVVLVA